MITSHGLSIMDDGINVHSQSVLAPTATIKSTASYGRYVDPYFQALIFFFIHPSVFLRALGGLAAKSMQKVEYNSKIYAKSGILCVHRLDTVMNVP